MMSNFWDAFTGSAQAHDLARGKKKADADLGAGFTEQQGDYKTASDMFAPYAAGGLKAQNFYDDALGLNGEGAQTSANSSIMGNPLFTGKLGQDQNQILAYDNAHGGVGGRTFAAGQQSLYQNFGDWLNRYKDAGAQGLDATGKQAAITTGMGDNAFGYGTARANDEINYANAKSQNESTGINNVFKVAGLAIDGANAYFNPAGAAMKKFAGSYAG